MSDNCYVLSMSVVWVSCLIAALLLLAPALFVVAVAATIVISIAKGTNP